MTGDIQFALYGPGDVGGLRAGAITARFPRPGQTDPEPEYCPYFELAEPDLPWRYSPEGAEDGGMLPWLALVVVEPNEVDRLGDRVALNATALAENRPSIHAGHTQTTHGREVARVLCRRKLLENRDYLALVVPVFDEEGTFRWDSPPRPFPVYDEWTFRTAERGTFEHLAEQLHAADMLADFGRIAVSLGSADGQTVNVRGALTGVRDDTDPPAPAAARDRLAELLKFDPDAGRPGHKPGFDRRGRRYVRPPDYGEAWLTNILSGAPAGGWVRQLNDDPTHRVVAGLGLQAGIDLQDEIAAAAADRFGATAAANGRVAALGVGMAVARSLWRRRVEKLGRDERISLLGLAAGRVLVRPVDENGQEQPVRPLLAHATGADRTLPPALFSTAARRVLRPGAARLRHAQEGATAILDAANTPRKTVRRPDDAPDDPRHSRGVVNGDALVAAVLASLGAFRVGEVDVEDGQAFVAALPQAPTEISERFREGLERASWDDDRPPPEPVDLDGLDGALVEAFDPDANPLAPGRVLGTIEPADPEPLAPREPCPDLDLPAWRYLRDRQREWLLPGASTLEDGEVVALASNPVFVDAFLVGMNTQALGELRWRNLGVAAGCTPLRRFWDRGDPADVADDITGVARWVGPAPDGGDLRAVPLGHASHTPRPTEARRQLVVVFSTDLFRRYPGTMVYLAPPVGNWQDVQLASRKLPSFSARITPKLVLYAFALTPEEVEQFWVVVEQQPPGFRFERDKEASVPSQATSAERAATMLVRPVRVLIAGSLLVGGA